MIRSFFKFITFLLSVVCIVLLCIFIYMKNKNNSNTSPIMYNKITSEIDFMSHNVINGINKLNNLSTERYRINNKDIDIKYNTSTTNEINDTSDKNALALDEGINNTNTQENNAIYLNNSLTESNSKEINWDTIENIYENLNNMWPSIMLDLKAAGISDDYLENITVSLNGIAQAILNKDKNSALINFYNLYSQFPYYLSLITKDPYIINLYNTKLAILNAYTLSNSENKWNEMSSSIRSARESFDILLSLDTIENNKKKNLEKISSMLRNLENSVSLNNSNLFYMQYKNVIQELEAL